MKSPSFYAGDWYSWEHIGFASLNPRFKPGIVHQVLCSRLKAGQRTVNAYGAGSSPAGTAKLLVSALVTSCDCGYTTHRDTAAAEVILARMEPSNANIPVVVGV